MAYRSSARRYRSHVNRSLVLGSARNLFARPYFGCSYAFGTDVSVSQIVQNVIHSHEVSHLVFARDNSVCVNE